jgi:hypothetical protein
MRNMRGASDSTRRSKLKLKRKRHVSNRLHRNCKLLLLSRYCQHIPGLRRFLPSLMRWKGRKRSFSTMEDPASRR